MRVSRSTQSLIGVFDGRVAGTGQHQRMELRQWDPAGPARVFIGSNSVYPVTERIVAVPDLAEKCIREALADCRTERDALGPTRPCKERVEPNLVLQDGGEAIQLEPGMIQILWAVPRHLVTPLEIWSVVRESLGA